MIEYERTKAQEMKVVDSNSINKVDNISNLVVQDEQENKVIHDELDLVLSYPLIDATQAINQEREIRSIKNIFRRKSDLFIHDLSFANCFNSLHMEATTSKIGISRVFLNLSILMIFKRICFHVLFI